MKFIKLEIQNLASLDRQGGETIEFEKGALGESTIFSIVGPTGSGKSTILDAICLALYNRAPRYPRKKGDKNQNIEIYGEPEEGEKNRLAPTDSRNILTRGKKDGYSKLTFLANNGTLYRAEWHVHLKNKNYDAVTTYLYQISASNGVLTKTLAEWEKLPQIIGLDYEQFLRTVLIAQGSFANFLTAKENERYELLEKLIGCEALYANIATKIKQEKDNAVKAYDQIAASFSAQEKNLIPEAELEPLKKRIKDLEEIDKQAKAELTEITKELAWYETEKKFQDALPGLLKSLMEAKQALEAFQAQADRLALHDSTVQAVTYYKEKESCRKNVEGCDQTLEQLDKDIKGKNQEIQQENENLQTLKEEEQKASDEFEKQKPHINKAREIKAQLDGAKKSVIEKEQTKKDAETAKKNADDASEKNQKAIEKAKQDLEIARNAVEKLNIEILEGLGQVQKKAKASGDLYTAEKSKLDAQDAASLQNAKSAADRKETDLKEAIRIQNSLSEKLQAQEKNLKEQERLKSENAEISEQLKEYDKIETLSNELETLRKSYTLMTSENWKEHRKGLVEGEACPLCGAIHHPYQQAETVAPVIDEMSKLIEKKEEELKTQNESKRKLTIKQGENEGLLKGISKALKTLSTELSKLGEEWGEIHSNYKDWPQSADLLQGMKEAIHAQAVQAADNLNAYNKLGQQVEDLQKKKEEDEKAVQTYKDTSLEEKSKAQKKVTDANTALSTENGKTATLKDQQEEKKGLLEKAVEEWETAQGEVTRKTRELQQEIGVRDPDEYEKTLSQSKSQAAEAVKAKTDLLGKLEGERKGLEGNKKATEDHRKSESEKLSENSNKLSDWLSDYNGKGGLQLSLEDIGQFSSATDDWEKIRDNQTSLKDKLTSARTTYQNKQDEHKKHQEDNKPAKSQDELTARKEELEKLSNDELVDSKTRIQRHEDAVTQMGGLLPQKQEKEQLKVEWEEISDAIGGDGKTLRKIAQCYTLRFLIEHANVEIRKFNTRYELMQVKNSLGIRVIDHDRADDVRDTTSLSGGETFIVSLGLALGLSALSSRNISFENLFIDEGFGTLDPDTLATVIDSLAMLQTSQGKKVGVISHTDTMSERITTQIRIIKNGNSGSSHIEIYP